MASNNAINDASPSAFTVTTGDLTVTSGNAVITAGLITLPTTTTTVGQITIGGTVFAHNLGVTNTFYGAGAGNLSFNTTNATLNTVIGASAFNAIAGLASGSDSRNVAIGYQAMFGSVGSAGAGNLSSNVAIGTQAMGGTSGTNDANQNVVVGDIAGYSLKGNENVVIGYSAFQCATNFVSNQNVMIGSFAAKLASGGSNGNVIIGYQAMANINAHTTINNTVVGYQAMLNINGNNAYNTIFGVQAGNGYTTTESSNILIGYAVAGTAGESNVLRIGNATGAGNGNVNKAFISGIYNIAVGATAGAVICDSTNQLGTISGAAGTILVGGTKPAFSATPTGLTSLTATTLYATTFDTNVAAAALQMTGTTIQAAGSNADITITLTPKGAGTLLSLPVYSYAVGVTNAPLFVDSTGNIGIVVSSARFKENIQDMGDDSAVIYKLRPVTFSYRTDETKQLKFGLIAEEVALIEPSLVSYDEEGLPYTVQYQDLPVMILNELQKIVKRVEALEEKCNGTK